MTFLDRPASRRRVIRIGAMLAGLAALPPAFAAVPVARWQGQALGAHASIELVGVDGASAAGLFSAVEAEIARLEAIFSLYRPDSAVAQLNAAGRLEAPPADLLRLLATAAVVHRETDGLFDPTVQPLFALYARHFALADADPTGPAAAAVTETLAKVGWDRLVFDEEAARFAEPGMALTLNGIAQGYVTDRIADLLRARGFTDMLLDIGEIQARGHGPAGGGWRVGLKRGPAEDAAVTAVTLSDRAVATSMPLGTVLDPAGRVGHIFHPRRGLVAAPQRAVSVITREAVRGDALSTAAVLMDHAALDALRDAETEIVSTAA